LRLLRPTTEWLCVLVAAALPVTAVASGKPAEGQCSRDDREALLVGGLLWEATAEPSHKGAPCMSVGLGAEKQVDPPKAVLFRLQKLVRGRVVPVSQLSKCPGGRTVWVAEPICSGRFATVQTTTNWHCSLGFVREGSVWTPLPIGPCE
jgi:hypothetical protein